MLAVKCSGNKKTGGGYALVIDGNKGGGLQV
jgi:hypothetical protein